MTRKQADVMGAIGWALIVVGAVLFIMATRPAPQCRLDMKLVVCDDGHVPDIIFSEE